MKTRAALVLALLAFGGCQKRDPLFCGMHPDDPRCVGLDGGDIPPGYVIVGGTVTGLTGAGLVIQNNGGDDKLIATSGSFRFATPIMMGTNYDVTIGTQPTNPSQACTVTNGSGTADTDVTNVQIDCTTATYRVGGTIAGCAAGCTGVLTLQDNGMDDLVINANGTFTFPTSVASLSPYSVTVKNGLPASCSVSGGTGIVGNADITTVVVNCMPGTYILGGMPPNGGVTGLAGAVGLHAAYTMPVASDTVNVSTNSFAFPTPLATGRGYTVTVSTQPSYPPASQTCNVTMGTGTITGSNVTSVTVACQTNKFTIGGNVSGLNGTLVLLDNGGDAKTITANGAFTFATPIQSGLTYMATVMSAPAGQVCTITMPNGTVKNGNVTTIGVSCGDAGVKCGASYCNGTQQCCDPTGSPHCIGKTQSCGQIALPCDDAADCGGGMKCCAMTHNGNGALQSVGCSATCGGSNPVQLCDPAVANECVAGTCSPWSTLPGYNACL